MPVDPRVVMIYVGRASLDDGERVEAVDVTLQGLRDLVVAHPFDMRSSERGRHGPKRWGGRIVANFDAGHWAGKIVTITLPTGGRGYVVVQPTGALTGVGDAPCEG